MREISILEEQLLDEYFRCKRNIVIQKKEIQNLPKGNLSIKNISGKDRLYLQWREGNQVKTKILHDEEIENVKKNIAMREKWKHSIKNLERSLKQLEKALGRKLILEYENEHFKIGKYENIKSEICHELKRKGDIKFIYDVLKEQRIWKYYKEDDAFTTLYLLGMVDYLSRINNIRLCTDFEELREIKFDEPIWPLGVVILDQASNGKIKQEALDKAIPEFMRHNIVECEVRDAV